MVWVRPYWRRQYRRGPKRYRKLVSAYGQYKRRKYGSLVRRRYGGYSPHIRRKTTKYVKTYVKKGRPSIGRYRLAGYRARRYKRRRKLFGIF